MDRLRASCALLAGAFSSPLLAFDYFEHRYLGNSAYRAALTEVGDPALSQALEKATRDGLGFGRKTGAQADVADRLLDQLPLQFGDLSALAGDFAEDAPDLRRLVREMLTKKGVTAQSLVVATRRQWFNACAWLYRGRGEPPAPPSGDDCLRRIAGDGGLERPAKSDFASRGYEASREELAANEMISNYVSLAAQNRSHFPRHSWKSYSDQHSEALRLASCYRRGVECPGPRGPLSGDELLVEALLNEAFAQHYLQDSFAAGHIGTRYGNCLLGGFLCKPTKRRVKQTHDALNELGLEVAMPSPPSHLADAADKLRDGWTAFGDDHLFVREADFHRAVVERTATESMKELLERARAGGEDRACRMCDSRIFPIPGKNAALLSEESRSALALTDLSAEAYPKGDLVAFEKACAFGNWVCLDERSPDPRISGVPVEGWKLGFGHARQSLGGNLRTGPLEQGAVLRIDYMRNTDPLWPNAYGFEFWGLPNFRSSYLLTAGYSWPREQSPLSVAVRAKYGWRIEDAFTRDNPDAQRVGGVEIVFPSVEFTYDVYPPVALFLTVNAATVFFKNGTRVTELINHNEFSLALGLRFDLSGI